MLRHLVPAAIRRPFARYSHAVEIPAGARLLVVSGQLGISPDDEIPEDVEAQAALCLAAIEACLLEAGMARGDIVRLNAYVTDRAHMPGYMAARDRFVADPPPASTLMIVSGFTRPEFKVEIEALAARAD
ncbi:RidA family protein [Ancylobacter rudongensis]|uniref:Enamine deaminase RidA, house cleaning of reactive enamine intermediates, YjgF/YER057c/UK114 family n=1 Tax=Ancylobacter rudongensis TaxID=177413 RepID=A0A1G4TZE2_9HYPH|nr:RidA family protein [Ancylobacter rudongensis]SCW86731.1 Enamine deaminase RidA, house cleaning of reactive enamine intermediates, YjgF/YER057c/UK114 family [Ancylobacter rudongensis]